jgi:hypothetical protein
VDARQERSRAVRGDTPVPGESPTGLRLLQLRPRGGHQLRQLAQYAGPEVLAQREGVPGQVELPQLRLRRLPWVRWVR